MKNLKEYADGVTDFAAPYLKKAGEYIYIAKDGVIHHYQNGRGALKKLHAKKKPSMLDTLTDIALIVGSAVCLVGSVLMLVTALRRRGK